VIAYRNRLGTLVTQWDRAVLLRRLVALTDAHDSLIAAGYHDSEEAAKIRSEAIKVLRRLGVPPDALRKITGRSGPLPRPTEEAKAEAAATDEED
jgi:hypothetical protein